MTRKILPGERFDGVRTSLRLVTLDDCTPRYEAWLADPEINQFLETRWRPQTLPAIREFVSGMLDDPSSYLFAILDRADGLHVGNIKIGPIQTQHSYADVSYFVGERSRWGKGLASDAIRSISGIGFERLGLHRCQAGVYAANLASCRALEKVGYVREGCFRGQLRAGDGWQDHLWYGLLSADWRR